MWFIPHKRIDPFTMDFHGPFGAEQVGDRQLEQQIAQRSGIQNVRVEQNQSAVHPRV
jgi:hypothetical protein